MLVLVSLRNTIAVSFMFYVKLTSMAPLLTKHES